MEFIGEICADIPEDPKPFIIKTSTASLLNSTAVPTQFIEMWQHLTELSVVGAEAGDEMFA